MARKKQSYIKGTFTHRRAEADYMACCWMPCRWKRGATSWARRWQRLDRKSRILR
jgi:hypothetical protein